MARPVGGQLHYRVIDFMTIFNFIIRNLPYPHLPPGDSVRMSLRGSETTEAISRAIDISEIAALPPVARNDRKGIATQYLEGRRDTVNY